MKDQTSAEDRAIQAAGVALEDAERRLRQSYAALDAATPAGAGTAVVTLRALQLRAEIEQAEAERDDARRRVRAAAQARVDRIVAEYGPRRLALLRRLLDAAEAALAAARALREADEEVARATRLLPPEFPLPCLLGPDPLGALRRMLDPPARVDPAPAPVPEGKRRLRLLVKVQDRDLCGQMCYPGDLPDFDEDAARDLIKRRLGEPVGA